MAYQSHYLFAFGGDLAGAGVEQWQCTIRGRFTPFSGNEDAFLADMVAPMKAWFVNSDNLMRQDARLTYLKLNEIAPSGDYAHPNSPHTNLFGAQPGGQAPHMPEFCSIACSWRTESSTKYARNGRCYFPNSTSSDSGQTRISAADQSAVASAGVQLLVLLRNGSDETAGGQFVGGVYSKHAGEGALTTTVRVGNVIDVQRRRKNALREAYKEDAVPPL